MSEYVHGVDLTEQERLAGLNRITNAPFLDFLNPPAAGRILEVGSGLGILASQVAEMRPKSTVVGIERSPEQLESANFELSNLDLQLGDAHSLPFAESSFDLVYCRYVLEHLTDPLVAIKEMHRVLRPGCRIVLQENDMGMVTFDPPCPMVEKWIGQLIEMQKEIGGDARVGRRLFGLLTRAEFANIRLSLQPEIHWYGCDQFEPWLGNAIGIVKGSSRMLLERSKLTAEEVELAVQELVQLQQNPCGSMLFHWNRAEAWKSPGDH